MGEVGRWDEGLFLRFRRAKEGGANQRRLINELARIHRPLLLTLLSQLRGDAPKEHHARRMKNHMRVRGAELLEWGDCLFPALIAFEKALRQFDPARGGWAYYLKSKIFYELQKTVQENSNVKVPKNHAPPPMDRGDDDAHFDRLLVSTLEEDAEDELPRIAGTGIVLRDVKPANQVVPHDDRPALQVLLEEHLRFAPGARVASTAIRGRFRSVAEARGEHANERALLAELRARGVRSTHVRTPWSAAACGFAGVTLQTASPRPAAPRTGVSGACLASPPGG